MDLIQSLTLAGVVLMSAMVLGGLTTLIYRAGRIAAKLDTMNDHLETLNGSVAQVTERAHENAVNIAALEGRHAPLAP